MSHDQVSFYDETLKKQIEGSYTDDGKKIHVMHQVYGARSAPRGGCFNHFEVELLAQKVLSELARDPGSGKFKDLQQQKSDQQVQPRESFSMWGSRSG